MPPVSTVMFWVVAVLLHRYLLMPAGPVMLTCASLLVIGLVSVNVGAGLTLKLPVSVLLAATPSLAKVAVAEME